jgi:hypothetical protein
MQRTLTCAWLCLSILACDASAEPTCWLEDRESGQRFRIFEAFKYSGKPDLEDLCIEPLNVLYAWNFFPRGPKRGDLTLPEARTVAGAIERARETDLVTVIDIEHWPLKLTDEETARASVRNYLTVFRQMKDALPNLTIGFYGVVPVIEFARARAARDDVRYAAWAAENTRAQGIADAVDALFPSLYTINPRPDEWVAAADGQLSEARRLAPGKPVYPFVWPNYHPQGGRYPLGTEVEPEYWRVQLEYLRRNADGVVLWGGNKLSWREDMPWWTETRAFIEQRFVRRDAASGLPGAGTAGTGAVR